MSAADVMRGAEIYRQMEALYNSNSTPVPISPDIVRDAGALSDLDKVNKDNSDEARNITRLTPND
jgi:hypothetical protein